MLLLCPYMCCVCIFCVDRPLYAFDFLLLRCYFSSSLTLLPIVFRLIFYLFIFLLSFLVVSPARARRGTTIENQEFKYQCWIGRCWKSTQNFGKVVAVSVKKLRIEEKKTPLKLYRLNNVYDWVRTVVFLVVSSRHRRSCGDKICNIFDRMTSLNQLNIARWCNISCLTVAYTTFLP